MVASTRENGVTMNKHDKVPSLPLLTAGLLGAQCVWSTEMAFGGPFLLHLGMTKSQMSTVFIAGPLSGLIVQPFIGVISDASSSKWGKRRPMLFISLLICGASLLLLGFARPVASIFTSDVSSQASLTIFLAVTSVFVVDFSVNAVTALDRALLIDLVPLHLQATANAWCARLAGIGGIIGFVIGQAELVTYAPFRWFPSITNVGMGEGDLTEAQLRCVVLLVVSLLLATHFVTMMVAKEHPADNKRDNGLNVGRSSGKSSSIYQIWLSVRQIISDLTKTASSLSRPILDLFWIQLCYSCAWFPVLFYSTTWVAQIAIKSPKYDDASAARLGSLAMAMHAVLSLACTLIIPPLLSKYSVRQQRNGGQKFNSLSMLWSISTVFLTIALICTWFISASNSIYGAMTIMALTGFPWALAAWAPYSLLGILIRKETEQSSSNTGVPMSSRSNTMRHNSNEQEAQALMDHGQMNDDEDSDGESFPHRAHRRALSTQDRSSSEEEAQLALEMQMETTIHEESIPEGGATILGLYNISVVIPQFFMTLISTVLFAILEPEVTPKDASDLNSNKKGDAVGVVLRVGGLFSLTAAIMIFRFGIRHATVLTD